MRNESDVEGRHAFRQSKTGELVDIIEAPQLSARLNASHARIRNSSFGFNWIRSHPNSWSTRTMVSLTTRVPIPLRVDGPSRRNLRVFRACDNARQAIVRAERLKGELIKNVDKLFASFPLDEENKAQRARTVDQRKRALAEWLDAQTARDSTGHSYRSAQTIVKHYRARNAAGANSGIDRLELQVRKEGMRS